jgi:hypothetical protein
MNPIGMLIARARGEWDFGSAWNTLLMHYPDFLIVGAAGVISHVVTQLGRQVTRAGSLSSQASIRLCPAAGTSSVAPRSTTWSSRSPERVSQTRWRRYQRWRQRRDPPFHARGGEQRRTSARRTPSRSTTSASPTTTRCTASWDARGMDLETIV